MRAVGQEKHSDLAVRAEVHGAAEAGLHRTGDRRDAVDVRQL